MIEEKIRKLIEGPVGEMGIMVDSVVYEKEGNSNFLRIVIDRDIPVDVDTCVDVTHVIDPLLDKSDIIHDSYILDISSKEKGDK